MKHRIAAALLLCLLLCACGPAADPTKTEEYTLPTYMPVIPSSEEGPAESVPETTETEPNTSQEAEPTEPSGTPEASTEAPTVSPKEKNGYVICVDPGHQGHANTDQEPLGPGSSEMKTKVSTGTQGRTTGVAEYVVNLQVALKLQKLLEDRGYTVIMTRTSHDVNISNAERAAIANDAGVDAFIRVHCNGVDNTSVNGILAMCQTKANPWNGSSHDEYFKLCQTVVDEMCKVTGAKNMGVQETDTMTGINWCKVPTALVEMGFMTNPEEDQKLVDAAYQDQLALGMANGLDAYFGLK